MATTDRIVEVRDVHGARWSVNMSRTKSDREGDYMLATQLDKDGEPSGSSEWKHRRWVEACLERAAASDRGETVVRRRSSAKGAEDGADSAA